MIKAKTIDAYIAAAPEAARAAAGVARGGSERRAIR